MSELLPSELWTEILVRLPVRTLVTLKCVSKYFLSLIQNPNFTYLHFSRFNNCYSESNHSDDLFLIDHISESEFGICRGNKSMKTLEFKISKDNSDDVVGYVDGLFWLPRFRNPWNHGFLCNPSIRQCFFIPPSPASNLGLSTKGFGYDPLTNDYKVVVIVLALFKLGVGVGFGAVNKPYTLVEVFSLRTGSWRSLGADVISHGWDLGMGMNVYANGAIHWLAHEYDKNPPDYLDNRPEDSHVVSFDLGREVFSFKEMPEVDEGENQEDMYERTVKLPVLFRGLLGVFYISRFRICLWVMTENVWTKEFMMESSCDEFHNYLCEVCSDGHFNNVIFCEKTSELLIATDKEGVISYNLETQQYTTLHKGVTCVGKYVENLLWRELLPPGCIVSNGLTP